MLFPHHSTGANLELPHVPSTVGKQFQVKTSFNVFLNSVQQMISGSKSLWIQNIKNPYSHFSFATFLMFTAMLLKINKEEKPRLTHIHST